MSSVLVSGRSCEWQFNLGDAVAEVSWSADGTVVSAGGVDGRLGLFRADGGGLLHSLAAHADGLFHAVFSPTEPLLATSGQDGKVRLWDASNATPVKDLPAGAAWVEQLVWSPQGGWLASGAGRKLRIWNPSSGIVHESADHRSTVSALTFGEDGRKLASACYGGVELWDVAAGKHLENLSWKTSLLSVAWSPDGRWVVAGTQEMAVQIWELPFVPGEELAMSGYPGKVRELAWHQSSRYLATGGGPEIMVWDCSGKGPAGTTPWILEGHPGKVSVLAYQRAGHALASGGVDGMVLLWNAGKGSTPTRQFKLSAAVTSIAWSPDGSRFVAGCRDGTVAVGQA
jgi:WD40 repeat protein